LNPPFRAEQIGSLLRPQALLDAWQAKAAPERLRQLEDEHIAAVIRWQERLGLRSITDGEFRRESATSTCSATMRVMKRGSARRRSLCRGCVGPARSSPMKSRSR
jgi:methionine synthase II (cobalamin-independent)